MYPFERQGAGIVESLLGEVAVGDCLFAELDDAVHHLAAQGIGGREVADHLAGQTAQCVKNFVGELLQHNAVLAGQRIERGIVVGDELVQYVDVRIGVCGRDDRLLFA